ncbi:MAG: mandelate racemase/muconate lactonizing enzyme family protein [Proteobacteria bacterium]|nr:mandelate racemase/muconate lactonizing enzyme family protein [Pseudomonadota bacterium]
MRIANVIAFPVSFPIPKQHRVKLGIGQTVKRDAVLVKVETDGGIVGWGESHAARAPTAIAELINTTLRQLVLGMDAIDIEAVWHKAYRMQLASHGAGAAAVIGLSGIDMALWDIAGKRERKPLYQLLGGESRAIPAYAGGISLGFQDTSELLIEVDSMLARGYRALKLRLGDTPARDIERVASVRQHVGEDVVILTDVNTAYTLAQVAEIMPTLDRCKVGWLEEPFAAHDYKNYQAAKRRGRTPLAAGENHYTRFDFERVVDDGAITVWQPDLSKTGGITEGLRIAALAKQHGFLIHPHTSLTSLNMAASVHFLCGIDNGGYFEADCSAFNPFRAELCSPGFVTDANSAVTPLAKFGLGVEVNEALLINFPVVPGPGYV